MKSKFILAATAVLLFSGADAGGDSLLPEKNDRLEFLPVDQAFELQPLERRDGKLMVSWRIARQYYLYRERLKFTLLEPAGARLSKPALPTAAKYKDEYFGEVEIYRETLRAELPYSDKGPVKLSVAYQGCADKGLCYPIQTRTLELTLEMAH